MNFFANEETAHEFPDFKRPKPKPAKKSFPEFRVRIYKSDNTLDEDLFFENQIGDRTKFGGRPNFIQNQDGCICNKCNREMTFIGQVDSFGLDPTLIAPAKEKQQWVLEDAGLIYFYVCYECGTGDCVLQSH